MLRLNIKKVKQLIIYDNPSYIFSYAKSKAQSDDNIPDLRDSNDFLQSEDAAKAEILNIKYTSIWSLPDMSAYIDKNTLMEECNECIN